MTPLFPCKQYNTCIYTLHLNIFDTRCLELMRGLRVKVRQFFFGRYFIHKKLKFHIVQEPFSIDFIHELKMELA